MTKFEKFLNSSIYPFVLAILAAIGWYFDGDLIKINYAFITAFLLWVFVLLVLFKDTKHILPAVISLFFMLNIKRIGMDVLETFSIAYVIVGLPLLGIIIHLIRFKPKLKFSWLSFSFLLIGISYLIPLIYTKVTIVSIMLSLSGLLYYVVYVFIKSTSTAKLETILNYFFFASITLILQIGYVILTGYLDLIKQYSLEETIRLGIKRKWGKSDYGYGNINSLITYLTILFSGTIYNIIKKPYNFSYWFVLPFYIVIVWLSGSRGGFLIWLLLVFFYTVIIATYGRRWQIYINVLLLVFFVGLGYAYKEIIKIVFEILMRGSDGGLNSFSSGRITLFKQGYAVFKTHPLFGAGWTHAYEPESANPNRVMIYHSTIIQTMAMTGIFGLVALFFHTVTVAATAFKRLSLGTALVIIVWGVTTLYGLIDNTIHLPIYMLFMIILFSGIENEQRVNLLNRKISLVDIDSLI